MKRFWLLVLVIFSVTILLGSRSSYTTSRITVLHPNGFNISKNRVTIRYEESNDTYNFHKRAEYHIHLEKHIFYDDGTAMLNLFSKDGASQLSLSLYIDRYGHVKRLSYGNLDRSSMTFIYNEDSCWNIDRSSCSRDEKMIYVDWAQELLYRWREKMELNERIYKIRNWLPPITPITKLELLDFMPPAKRKSTKSKIIIRRQNPGTQDDRAHIYYVERIDGVYYQKMATYMLHMKGHGFFDDYQGYLILFSRDNAERIYLKIDIDGLVVRRVIKHMDVNDGTVMRFSDQELHTKQAYKLWKAWHKRLGLKRRVPELLESPPPAMPAQPIVFENYMP